MMRRKIRHNGIRLMVCLLTLSTVMGCGAKQEKNKRTSADIELLDPANSLTNTEIVSKHNFYKYTTYDSNVYPHVTQYSFDVGVTFGEFCYYPGDTVKKGDVLCTSVSELRERLAAKQDAIDALTEAYEEEIAQLKEARDLVKEKMDERQEYAAMYGNATQQVVEELRYLAIELSAYNRKISERKALYQLDYDKQNREYEKIKSENAAEKLVASADGVVVATGNYYTGSYIGKETPVIAVADEEYNFLRCTYMSEKTVQDAVDLYAMIDGVRYELEYLPYSSVEYNSILAKGGKVYSTFRILDPEGQIHSGDYGIIVYVEARTEDVLAVPSSSIHKDADGYYVYRLVGSKNERAYIETGVSDTVYTEVTNGLAAGDEILLTEYVTTGTRRTTLTRTDLSSDYEGDAYFSFPDYDVITNEITAGSMFLGQWKVSQYEVVKKGQTILTVSVESDGNYLAELELRLQRLKERKEDLKAKIQKADADPDDEITLTKEQRKSLEKQLQTKRDQISELEEEIALLKEELNKKKYTAPYDGIILRLAEIGEGGYVSKDAELYIIAKMDTCYLETSNSQQTLNYGNLLEVEYKAEDGSTQTITAEIVSVSKGAIDYALRRQTALLKISKEVLDKLSVSTTSASERYLSLARYKVRGTARSLKNVILVPRYAVSDLNGRYYVYTLDENGNRVAKTFIPGGGDVQYFWVAEGLEEGMILCSE